MKRVGYGRVSTAGQARNGTSLAEQKKLLMAAGVAEEDIYLDAYTGTEDAPAAVRRVHGCAGAR